MAGMRHSDSDGSDLFWPGYVDAVTNLVLNLLFLLTIMTVAVFMFALELGRASMGGSGKTPGTAKKMDANLPKQAKTDPLVENAALKQEIDRLNKQLAKLNQAKVVTPGPVRTVEATSTVPKPAKGVERTQATEQEVIVRFTEEAVALTPAEHDRLLETLRPIVAAGRANISVEVPAGFSEAKRLAFYRAMAVRNLLIEMKLPKEQINVAVKEGKTSANNTVVRVKSR